MQFYTHSNINWQERSLFWDVKPIKDYLLSWSIQTILHFCHIHLLRISDITLNLLLPSIKPFLNWFLFNKGGNNNSMTLFLITKSTQLSGWSKGSLWSCTFRSSKANYWFNRDTAFIFSNFSFVLFFNYSLLQPSWKTSFLVLSLLTRPGIWRRP